MLENPLYNPGGYFTNLQSFAAISNNWTSIGEIVNLTDDGEYQSHLIQRYDVQVYNMGGMIVKGCIPVTNNFSGNGVGEYATYKVGDAVIVTSLYGSYDSVVILGAVSLPGNMDVFMGKDTERYKLRQLQADNTYAPQPLITPDRAQNPSANKIAITSTQMDKDSYKNTDLLKSSSDRVSLVREQGLPNGIEVDSGLGDKGTYFRGVEYKYINGNYYQIVVADKEDKCAKSTKVAMVALDKAKKLKELGGQPRNSNSLIDTRYRAEQYQRLHDIALETAKKCNTKAIATKQAINNVTTTNTPTSGTKVPANYKPNESKLDVKTSEPRLTLTRDQVIGFVSNKQWNNSLPKDQEIAAIRTLYLYYGLKDDTKGQVTQPLIDKILADPDYATYKKTNK